MKYLYGRRKGKQDLALALVNDHDEWSIQGDWIVIDHGSSGKEAIRILAGVERIIEGGPPQGGMD